MGLMMPVAANEINVPRIRLTQSERPVLNVVDLFWLPAGEQYGNLVPKLAGIHQRVFETSRQLELAFNTWAQALQEPPSDAATRHLFAVEHAVYHMRRAADELIGLRAVVSYYAESDEWSDSVDPDCVGRLLAREDLCALEPHRDRRELLTRLNDLHNARKHSFLNTDTALIGRDEPTANAIHRRGNRGNAPLEVYGVSLRVLAEGFQAFALAALGELRDISGRIQNCQKPN
jgi:hypothetical protein